MLIRSQDKTAVVNVDNVFDIGTRDINGATAICIGSSTSFRNIAEYSTKAKALKVLDMIQEAYADFEATKCISTGLLAIPYSKRFVCDEELDKTHTAIRECADMLKKAHIFQMPQDGSVEV